jgi:hypothetical protein
VKFFPFVCICFHFCVGCVSGVLLVLLNEGNVIKILGLALMGYASRQIVCAMWNIFHHLSTCCSHPKFFSFEFFDLF